MTFTSPLPSISLPALPLTPYILERAGRLADKAAFIDGVTGRTMTYGEFEDAVRRQAGGWLEDGLAKGEVVAVMAPNCPEYGVIFHAVALAGGVVTTVNPTYTAGEVHHQLVDSGATRLVTVPMFLETVTAAIADSPVKEVYVIGDADGYVSIASLAGDAARRAGAGRSRRRRRAAVLVGHDRSGEGRHAHAPQPRLEHRAGTRHGHAARGRRLRRGVAVLPHLRDAGADEPRAARRRHDRHDATVRSRTVPVVASGASPHPRVRRPADGRRPGEASRRRQLRPFGVAVDPLRRGAAVGRPGDRVRPAAWMRSRAGLRHDRTVTGEPRHAVGHVQTRLGRRHGPEHRGQHRRSGDGVAAWASTRTAKCGSAVHR